MNDVRESRSRSEIKKPSLRTVSVALLLVASGIVGGVAYFALAAPSGSGPSVTTLGNQERQDINAANQWVEGNIDFWLESHLYDAAVRLDSGSTASTLPNTMDISYSFFFPAQNSIVMDWTQDWHVTLKPEVMYRAMSDSSLTPTSPFSCPVPPNIATIPKGGSSIMVPQAGSVCLSGSVAPNTTGNPATGWADLMPPAITGPQLIQVLPIRNAPCSTIVGGLCSAGTETEASPAGDHFFRVSLSGLFGSGGLYASQYSSFFGGASFPTLPAGKHVELYFRAHLSLTAIWQIPGGGLQPEFCTDFPAGVIRNTVNRCDWTHVSRLGSGFSPGSKNHGAVQAPGIGSKTIPLPQVVAPTGFITVCKKVTLDSTDLFGDHGTLTNGWQVRVQGPFSTDMMKLTGSFTTGCARFGPLFPASGYLVSETLQAGFIHIGTVVLPAPSRDAGFGVNPDPYSPVSVTLTFSQAQMGTGPTVTFVNTPIRGSLRWFKVDNLAAPLAGATFEVCRTHDFNPATNTFVEIVPHVCVTVLDNSAPDEDPVDGTFFMSHLTLGRYTVRETIPPPGFAADPDTVTVELTVATPDVTITPAFVDLRPILKISEFGYTNTPIGLPTDGSGTVVYTAKIRNFGGAAALVTGSLTVTLPAGFVCVTAGAVVTATGCMLSWSNVAVAPFGQSGDEVTFVLTVRYISAPNGFVISATLVSTYTTPPDTLVRDASGSPATISFTVRRN